MTRITGRLTKIGIAKETTRGTAVAPVFWVPVLDLGFDDNIELKDNESGFGNLAAIQDSGIVKKWGEGDYSGKVFDKSVGVEMTATFGQSPTIVQRGTTGVYDHSWTMLQSNQHQTMTVAITEPNYTGRFPRGMVNSWSLKAEVGDWIKRTINVMSNSSASSSETVAYTNENEFLPKHMSVRLAAAGASSGTIDAATPSKMRAMSFEINKNTEDQMVFGSNDPDDIANDQIEVTGEFEVYYDDRTYHTLAQAGTHQAMRIEMINTDVIIGSSGSNNPALRFEFAECIFEEPERNFDNNGIQTLKVKFKAALNLATGNQVTGRLTNAYAGTAY